MPDEPAKKRRSESQIRAGLALLMQVDVTQSEGRNGYQKRGEEYLSERGRIEKD